MLTFPRNGNVVSCFFPDSPSVKHFAGLLVLMLAVCAARCYAGLAGITAYPHDVFALLDPAWRILHHQRPHIDFYSNLGPIPYLETAAGLILSRNGMNGLIYGQVITGLLSSVWIYSLTRAKLPEVSGILAVSTLLLSISPFNVGESFTAISAAMTYNRLSYALTAIILVESLPLLKNSRSGELVGGLSTGAALGLLLFTKITFFLGAIGLVSVFGILYPRTKTRWKGLAIAFGLSGFVLSWYLHFDYSAIYHDYRLTALAKRVGPAKVAVAVLEVATGEGISVVAFLCLACLVMRGIFGSSAIWRVALSGVVVVGLGLLLIIGNFQNRGMPLNAYFALWVAGLVIQNFNAGESGYRAFRLTLIGWGVLLAMGPIVTGIASIGYAAVERAGGKLPAMHSGGLAAFRIRDQGYAEFIDDGVLLAERHWQRADKIASLDFSDFYSYALRAEPRAGGASCMHFGSTFNDASHPAAQDLLGDASIVMVPITYSELGSQLSMPRIYGPYLALHFHLDASSEQWRLYRRNL